MNVPVALTEEKALLGCMMSDPTVVGEITTRVQPDALFHGQHKALFELLSEMHVTGKPTNDLVVVLGVAREKQCDNIVNSLLIQECLDATPSALNFPVYASKINEAHSRRKFIEAAQAMLKSATDETVAVETLLGQAESRVSKITQETRDSKSPRIIHGGQASREAMDWLEWRFNNQGALSGLETPFAKMNEMTDGFQQGELSVIAARPSQGKTALALNCIELACFDNNIPTLFFSLEMHHRAIQGRLACSRMRIDSMNYRRGLLEPKEFARLSAFNKQVTTAPYYVTTSGDWNVDQIASTSAQFIRQKGVKLIVLDYVQKVKASSRQEKRTYEVGEVIQGLKEIAKRHGVHFMALAQLNRESEKEKGRAPRMSDIGDSKQIEQEADLIGLLHHHSEQPSPAFRHVDLIIAKQRDGDTGIVPLKFHRQFVRFEQRNAYDEMPPNPHPSRPE